MKKGMEPKIIKEENTEKDGNAGYVEAPRTRSKGKDRCKTPESPETNRPILSPTQSSPTPPSSQSSTAGRHPPPPPLPPTNGSSSPVNNGSADSLTPPLPTALSVNLDINQTQQYNNHVGYATSLSSSTNITRPLIKVKRLLGTLVQFGSDLSPDIGERVRSLVLNLVSSNLSIEEFHHSLQDVTNFPLRPFVLPFLRTHLPLLQREVHALARNNKQSTLQYVRAHDHVILDSSHSPTELAEIFLPNDTPLITGIKRRASDSIYENGTNGHPNDQQDCLPIKRPLTSTSQNSYLFSHQSLLLPNVSANIPNSHFFDYNHPHPSTTQRYEDNNSTTTSINNNRGDEEWRNIHVMLNCILSMVEKTKRALTILQQRNSQDLTNEWLRKQDVGVDLKKAANDIMVQAVRQTEDRVAEVRRRAEDAVNDVKRQAVIELQKAVAAAETKANELVAAERAKMEKLLAEARKHSDETPESIDNNLSPSQPAPSQQNSCWNCGRKAHETCSGCNVARYCGPFCQHKDWENHHQICSKEKSRPLRTSTPSTTTTTTTNIIGGGNQHIAVTAATTETVKFKK